MKRAAWLAGVALLCALGGTSSFAQTSTDRCRDEMARLAIEGVSQRLRGLACERRGGTRCRHHDGSEYSDKIQALFNGAGGACYEALQVDGVPVGDLAPPSCEPRWTNLYYYEQPIFEPGQLFGCYYRLVESIEAKVDFDLDGETIAQGSQESATCVARAYKTAARAIATGLREAVRCVKRGVDAAECRLDGGGVPRFDVALTRVERRVSRCVDAATSDRLIPAARDLCHEQLATAADLAGCVERTAKCVACITQNLLHAQTQDCSAYAGDNLCGGYFPEPYWVYVANSGNDTVTYYWSGLHFAFSGLAGSSFPVGSAPSSVVSSALTGTVYVANAGDDTVSFLDTMTAERRVGGIERADVLVEDEPRDLVIAKNLGVLYVVNTAADSVSFLNPVDGSYLFGTLANSTFGVGDAPLSAAVNENAGVLYVANSLDGTVTYLDARTGDYVGGSLQASTALVGVEPVSIVYSGVENTAVVADRASGTIAFLDPLTPGAAFGTLAASTFVATPGIAHLSVWGASAGFDDAGAAFGAEFVTGVAPSAGALARYDAAFGHRDFEIIVGGQPTAVVYDSQYHEFYVVDAGAGLVRSYRGGGTGDASTEPIIDRAYVSPPPVLRQHRMALSANLDRIYVAGDRRVSGYRASTYGYYIGSSLPFQSYEPERARVVAVNDVDEVVYVAVVREGDSHSYLYFLDATTLGLPLDYESSRITLADTTLADIEVDSDDGRLYVLQSNGVLHAFDAAAPGPPTMSTSLGLADARAIALDVSRDVIAVGDAATDTVVFVDASNFDFLYGTGPSSGLPIGGDLVALQSLAPQGVTVAGIGGNAADPGNAGIVLFDTDTGQYRDDSLAGSTRSTGDVLEYLTTDPAGGRIYVLYQRGKDHGLAVIDAGTGEYVGGSLEAATMRHHGDYGFGVAAIGGAVVNPLSRSFDIWLSNGAFTDREAILRVDPTLREWIVPSLPAVTGEIATGPAPSDLSVLGSRFER